MVRAGGIIALIAGVLGILAGVVTLMVGGLGAALEAEGAGTVVGLGWGGLFFSFACIVLGAIAAAATPRSRLTGVLLIICAIAGAILGGTLVAVIMILALVGGILATVGKRPKPAIETDQ
ncbi:MAG TPA: hypothetical protein GX702_02035 [Chloroflexi bacterium]|nr:hypothetical protein [Chloroflexota bacterium]